MKDIAIKVEDVSKVFKLPHEKAGSVKSAVVHLRRDRGYELQQALKNISFDIKQGEFFGIVGRNGSGKSTLLKIIAGIYQPTEGRVTLNGKIVPFIELGVGFNPELTGRENVFLNGALLGFSRKEMQSMYKEIVDFAELERFMDQKLKNYSSGMQVRLAFSIAIRARSDILLIDEVLAVGDADFQRKCFSHFNQLKKEKATVVFVSHSMEAIREYCDRAMLIEDSKLLNIGDTDKIAQDYTKLFLDSSPTVQNSVKKSKRWGDKTIQFKAVSATVDKDSITIVQRIVAKEKMERPVAGFRIRDAQGNEVTGTNTKKEKIHFGDLRKGDKVTITWKMPNILSDGEYSLDPSLLYFDEISVADWWNDAAHFSVNKSRRLPYSIDPGFRATLSIDGAKNKGPKNFSR